MVLSSAAARLVLSILALAPATALSAGESGGEGRFLANTRQLIFEGARSGEGYFSADGTKMIFQSEREEGNPFYQIYILDFESGESHRVSPGTGKTTCPFFRPDGKRVLFASTHLDPDAVKKQEEELAFRKSGKKRRYSWDYDATMDIFTANPDGSERKRLTDAVGYDAEGAYSPDGRKIVFCSLRSGYEPGLSEADRKRLEVDPSYFGEIYIMNADGSNQERLTDDPGYDGGPFFTPSGDRIVWRHFGEDGMIADVYTMKLDGSDVRRITNFGAMSWAPYFHPSGKYIVFASNKLGFSNFELYMTDALGEKEPVRVTYTDRFDGLPVFSPDGTRLAWTATRAAGGTTQIYLADWNHDAALAAIGEAPPRSGAAEVGETEAKGGRSAATVIVGATSIAGVSPFSPEISAADLERRVAFLASDEREGRLTGSKGAREAADSIAAALAGAGVAPAGDAGGYFQEFPFPSAVEIDPDETALMVYGISEDGPALLELDRDFRPLSFSSSGGAHGDVVFCGYGLVVPGENKERFDSYNGLDVSGKVVLLLDGVPLDLPAPEKSRLHLHAGLREKALAARDRGAVGVLVVRGPHSDDAGKLIPLSYDTKLSDAGIPAASIAGDAAERMFAAAGENLDAVGADLAAGGVSSFPLDGISVRLYTALRRSESKGRNVIGVLPPRGGEAGGEYILICAHYDHLGHGEIGSLAGEDEKGEIHNGADDNASGTAVVLELAAALGAKRKSEPEKFDGGFLFALWSGEELGLVGSSFFADHPVVPIETIDACLNFDMVGRLRKNHLTLQGIGSSNAWPALIERKNVLAGFDIAMRNEPFLPTDATSLYKKGVPALTFFTGVHDEYSRPADKASTLNYDGLEKIGRFALRMALDLAQGERPAFTAMEKPSGMGGAQSGGRPYLGTIPDYAGSDVKGVRLTGVREGGPAAKGGVRGGDVIIRFAGSDISNIYEYTNILDVVNVGEPVEITVLRDGKKIDLTVIPESKK